MKHAALAIPLRPSETEAQVIRSNFDQFHELVARARELLNRGRYDEAALHSEIAAHIAVTRHCGLFVSGELERILIRIGTELRARLPRSERIRPGCETPRSVLHVATSVMGIGGLSRMLLRWIRHDAGRTHSLALTRQVRTPVPQVLKDAVTRTGGRLYHVNEKRGGLLSWARELRAIAGSADLIVLHVFNYDVVPLIAFADRADLPAVAFIDHADHMFWLGNSISDVVISLRESGRRLAQQRRRISPERSLLLPIVLEPTKRVLTRAEAKRQLGLPQESVLLLSTARELKYRTMHGTTYADVHVPTLERHGQAILMVVGPGARADWGPAIERTQGRIVPLPEQHNLSIFQQAADIYVDSFPFVSTTSLLEAGSYGVPLVSRNPYSSKSDILAADAPGLTGTLLQANTLDAYTSVLSKLIDDEDYRGRLGEVTRTDILDAHAGRKWQCALEKVYQHCMSVPKRLAACVEDDSTFVGEPDAFIAEAYGSTGDVVEEALRRIRSLPLQARMRQWHELTRPRPPANISFLSSTRFLCPEWLACRIFQRLLPGMAFPQMPR